MREGGRQECRGRAFRAEGRGDAGDLGQKCTGETEENRKTDVVGAGYLEMCSESRVRAVSFGGVYTTWLSTRLLFK